MRRRVAVLQHVVGKYAMVILFVIVLGTLAALYENQQAAIDKTNEVARTSREVADANRKLVARLEAQQETDRKAACQASLEQRNDQAAVLNQVITAIPNPQLVTRLQAAIAHAFDEPPKTCEGVDLSQP